MRALPPGGTSSRRWARGTPGVDADASASFQALHATEAKASARLDPHAAGNRLWATDCESPTVNHRLRTTQRGLALAPAFARDALLGLQRSGVVRVFEQATRAVYHAPAAPGLRRAKGKKGRPSRTVYLRSKLVPTISPSRAETGGVYSISGKVHCSKVSAIHSAYSG